MLNGGADPRYLGRRLVRMASEDIGLIDPRALEITLNACAAYERLGSAEGELALAEGELALAEAAVYLAVAAKSNALYLAYNATRAFVAKDQTCPVPEHLRNAPHSFNEGTRLRPRLPLRARRTRGLCRWRKLFAGRVTPPHWYQPTPRGLEQKISEKLAHLRDLDHQTLKQKKT